MFVTKKLFLVAVAIMLVLSLLGSFGCSGPVKTYMDENSEKLQKDFEDVFESSIGMDCTCSVKSEDDNFIVDVNILELDDVPEDTKKHLQNLYDGLRSMFNAKFAELRKEVPELEKITININDKDGDNLAIVESIN